MKRILAIDGGGLHGIIPAAVLAELERKIGGRLADRFDLIAGTSIGGIMAVALGKAEPMKARDLLRLFVERGDEIFPSRALRLPWLFRPKYDARPLERILREKLGAAALSTCRTKVMVTAYHLERRQAVLMKSWGDDADLCGIELWAAARATSAAPTYFAPFRGFCDGGVAANNPAALAYAGAQELWPGEPCLLVSLGTGATTRPILQERAKAWGLLGWAPSIISLFMDGGSDAMARALYELPGCRHVRLDTELLEARDEFDLASREQIAALRADASRLLREHARTIADLAAQLRAA